MNLSFPPFDRSQEVSALPDDLAALLEGIATRQAGAPCAEMAPGVVARANGRLLAPLDGAFNGAMARALIRWRDG